MPRSSPLHGALAAAAVLVLAAAPAAPATRYVNALRGSDAGGDGSRLRPWKTITHALARVIAGDHLVLSAGLYDASHNGETFPLFVRGGVSLHGDPLGRTRVRDDRHLRPDYGAIVLEPNGRVPGWTVEHLAVTGADPAALGGIQLLPSWDGGGPLVRRNRVSGFQFGIFTLESVLGPTLGGEFRPVLDANVLTGNGAAVALSYQLGDDRAVVEDRTRVVNSLIAGNGYGVVLLSSSTVPGGPTLRVEVLNNTFVDNGFAVSAEYRDAGVVCVDLWNNVIAFNRSGFGPCLGTCDRSSYLDHNDFFGNDADFPYPGCAPGAATLAADPLFLDPAGGDFHLRPGSPCIDAGLDQPAPGHDVDGDPRPLDGDGDGRAAIDIGADEAGGSPRF